MKKILWSVFFIFTLTTSAQAASRVEFILDVSGSMNKLTSGEKRIDLARKAMAAAVGSIPDGSIVALRQYGHRIPPSDKVASCKDTELVIPFGPINKQQMINLVNQSNPLGETPIAYSLEQAANDFPTIGDEQPVIILVSDGEESCGGDPVAVAKALLAKGFKVTIHTIGLDVDSAAQAQLQGISQATGGQYKDARDAAGLTQSLQQLTQESLLVKKDIATYGTPIRGGNSYETAVALAPGQQFHLDHHQRKNEFDFFYIDVKDGQKLEALLQTGVKGVSITGEKLNEQIQENNSPYAGLQIHSPQRQRLVAEEIIGDISNRKLINVPLGMGQGGRYFVLIGSTYDNQHKDNPFTVTLVDMFDAGTTADAGDTETQALPLQPGVYPKNYLSANDKIDMFKMTAAPGASYAIKARPTSEKKRLQITIKDADGVQLAEASSPNEGAAVKIDNFGSVKGGELFIKLASYYSDEIETDYQLEITGGAPQAVAPSSAPPGGATEGKPTSVPPAPGSASAPGTLKDSKEVCLLIKSMPWMQKAKFYGFYVGIPLFAGWLIGMIWGYIKGRKAGKKKALAQK
jgi:hypothetical protein